uniref:ABC transporter substrate-binding protein n=1 Tax=Clostridium sp. NkU-1 TaxID=1095009 RepID=UPI0006D00349
MKFRKMFGVIALLLTLTFAFTACSSKTEPADGNAADTGNTSAAYKYGKLDLVGKDGALCGAPTYIAKAKGFFAEEGFDVTLISADTETRKTLLNNGQLPLVNGDFQFFPSIENGVNVSVVDGLHNGCIKFLVKADSQLVEAVEKEGAKALKGLKIGVDEVGGTPHQVASVWLEQAGVSAKAEDGEVTFLPFSDGNLEIEALKNGDIDVAALWDPFGSVQEKTGSYMVIFDLSTDPVFAGKYCCFLYASNKVLKEEPEKVAALLRAYHKAQEWIAENPAETAAIISDEKYSSIEDKELAAALIEHYEYPSKHDHDNSTRDVAADVEYFAEQLYDIGYLTTAPADFIKTAYQKVDLTLGQ